MIRGKCPKCCEQDLVPQPTRVFRLGLPWLNSLVQAETPYVCQNCGSEVRTEIQNSDNYSPGASLRSGGNSERQ